MKQIAFRHESFSEELTQSDTLYSVNVALPTSLGAGKQCPDNRSNNADFETELAIHLRDLAMARLLLCFIDDD
jgi:hypothetical protein